MFNKSVKITVQTRLGAHFVIDSIAEQIKKEGTYLTICCERDSSIIKVVFEIEKRKLNGFRRTLELLNARGIEGKIIE